LSKSELSNKLKKEALSLEKEIKIAQGKKLTSLQWRYAKIIARVNEIENPYPLFLKRYDD
jgi:hypothetical protein